MAERKTATTAAAAAPEKPAETVIALVPAPDRKPSIAQRRMIADALETNYNTQAGIYKKDFTDERIAKALNLPRAWVTEVRELMYGESGSNEAEKKAAEQMTGMEPRLKALENQILGECERALKAVEEMRAELTAALRKA